MKKIGMWMCLFAFLSAAPAVFAATALSLRQNHLLFDFSEEGGVPVCWIQEIVVVTNPGEEISENSAGTVRFSIPPGATDVTPAPLPPVMPGMDAAPPLQPEEVAVENGEFVVKRHLHPGKNSFSFRYKLSAANDVLRIEKKILMPTHLMAAFAPLVDRLTSTTLSVEKAEDGYKIIGQSLQPGTTVDLTFEGVKSVIHSSADRRDGSDMATGAPDASAQANNSMSNCAMSPSGPGSLILSTVAGVILAVLIVLYFMQRRSVIAVKHEMHRMLMDEIEHLDEAAEKKEITSDYLKRRKKALMDKLRTPPA